VSMLRRREQDRKGVVSAWGGKLGETLQLHGRRIHSSFSDVFHLRDKSLVPVRAAPPGGSIPSTGPCRAP